MRRRKWTERNLLPDGRWGREEEGWRAVMGGCTWDVGVTWVNALPRSASASRCSTRYLPGVAHGGKRLPGSGVLSPRLPHNACSGGAWLLSEAVDADGRGKI